MLSIVPGGDGSGGGLNSGASKPTTIKKSNSFQKRTGRSNVTQSTPKSDENTPRVASENSSMEELERMLEDDALALSNMRREISESQKHELLKLQEARIAEQKEYDLARIANEHRENELKSLITQLRTLQSVQEATVTTTGTVNSQVAQMQSKIASINEEVMAEQRTLRMQEFIIKRMEEEIMAVRLEAAKTSIIVEHNRHDATIAETNLLMTKQDLLEEEIQLDKLQHVVKQRKEERESKILTLQNLSRTGEQSVTKLQHSLSRSGKVQ
jgi:hypothetical protein